MKGLIKAIKFKRQAGVPQVPSTGNSSVVTEGSISLSPSENAASRSEEAALPSGATLPGISSNQQGDLAESSDHEST